VAKRRGKKLKKPKASGKAINGVYVSPRPASDTPPQAQYPSFSLKSMDSGYTLQDCDEKTRAAFAEKIYQLSQLTWHTIQGNPSVSGLGTKKIRKKGFDRPIPKEITADTPLLAIRFHGSKARMVGYRRGSVFHVVWIDRSPFTLYSH